MLRPWSAACEAPGQPYHVSAKGSPVLRVARTSVGPVRLTADEHQPGVVPASVGINQHLCCRRDCANRLILSTGASHKRLYILDFSRLSYTPRGIENF